MSPSIFWDSAFRWIFRGFLSKHFISPLRDLPASTSAPGIPIVLGLQPLHLTQLHAFPGFPLPSRSNSSCPGSSTIPSPSTSITQEAPGNAAGFGSLALTQKTGKKSIIFKLSALKMLCRGQSISYLCFLSGSHGESVS